MLNSNVKIKLLACRFYLQRWKHDASLHEQELISIVNLIS